MSEPAAVESVEQLSAPILKLQQLELIAAEALGAAAGVSRFLDNARGRRGGLERDTRELEQHRTGDRAVRENVRRRIGALAVRLAYATAEIEAAARLHEELNSRAGAARTAADNLAEHLRAELAAMGLR